MKLQEMWKRIKGERVSEEDYVGMLRGTAEQGLALGFISQTLLERDAATFFSSEQDVSATWRYELRVSHHRNTLILLQRGDVEAAQEEVLGLLDGEEVAPCVQCKRVWVLEAWQSVQLCRECVHSDRVKTALRVFKGCAGDVEKDARWMWEDGRIALANLSDERVEKAVDFLFIMDAPVCEGCVRGGREGCESEMCDSELYWMNKDNLYRDSEEGWKLRREVVVEWSKRVGARVFKTQTVKDDLPF